MFNPYKNYASDALDKALDEVLLKLEKLYGSNPQTAKWWSEVVKKKQINDEKDYRNRHPEEYE